MSSSASPPTDSGRETRHADGMADLHLHSNHSDGTESPAEVMHQAHRAGMRTVALTDHDQITGWDDAATAARSLNMTFLPAMELSVQGAQNTMHLLAYLFDPDNRPLMAEVTRIRDDRRSRARRIVDKLTPRYGITWPDVTAVAGEGVSVGRPHIADALVIKGVSSSRADAFENILDVRHDFYEHLYAPDVRAAIKLVAAAGGVPILAHPITGSVDDSLTEPRVAELIDAGLAGFEIDHRDNTPSGRALLNSYIRSHDLIATGSSDYHGAGKPNVLGENTTTDDMVTRIIELGRGSTPLYPTATEANGAVTGDDTEKDSR